MRVLPDVAGLSREFDYLAGPDQLDRIEIGSLVRVELNRRRVAGWVTAIGETVPDGLTLRRLLTVSSVGPSAELVELARWVAWRWSGRVSSVLKSASPPRMVASLPAGPPADRPQRGAGDGQDATGWARPGTTVVRVSPTEDLVPRLAELAGLGNVVVVAPQLATARHIAGRLRSRGVPARVHPRDWRVAAARGGVVVGARSAVWARVPRLDAIAVVDEHDEALQEERNPTWHVRDLAIERARRAGAPCVLLSPCPSPVAVELAHHTIEPSRSEERAGWPIVEVVDRRDAEPGRSGLFSTRVVDAVRQPGRVLAVLNRKGRAVMLACVLCGELARTTDGDRLMAERDGMLVCDATGETRPVVCDRCGGTRLKRLRLGVNRAAEELAALAGEPVGELTGSGKGTASSDGVASSDSGASRRRIIVGTEAALRQLDEVATVIFLDFDQELLAPRYRAAEQAMALLVLAARLVGPRNHGAGGRIVLQTRSPEHRVVRAAVRADPARLSSAERELRQAMGFPPFGALAQISGAGAEAFVAPLRNEPDLAVLGPRPDGRYLLRAGTPELLADTLAAASRPSEQIRVAVDPPRA